MRVETNMQRLRRPRRLEAAYHDAFANHKWLRKRALAFADAGVGVNMIISCA